MKLSLSLTRLSNKGVSARTAQSRPVAALVLALGALLLCFGSAAAHVTVQPAQPRLNTSETFSVRVPTERDEPTVAVRVEFPTGLVVSRFQPKPGWQRETTKDSAGAITSVTWTGGRIENGEYDDFAFVARTPQTAGKIAFKAYQTYQSGTVAEWIGAEGSASPAPVADVQPAAAAASVSAASAAATAAAADHGATTAAANAAATAARPQPTTTATGQAVPAAQSSGSDLPLFLALGAGLLALVAVALSGVAIARRPQAA